MACLFAYWFTVDRHGLSALAMTRWGRVREGSALFVIARRERKRGTWQSIVSRMTRTASLFAYWFTVDRHGLRPRDDKSEGEWRMIWAVRLQHTVCHCEEGTERGTRQSIVSRGTRTTCLFAYWFKVDRHGLSALAMTSWGRVVFCAYR
jgi:hypothetical protein